MKKEIISLAIATSIMLSGTAANTSVLADDKISVVLNGETLQFPVEPQIIDGTTMVPMRAIFEALGYSVTWNGDVRSITAVNEQSDKYILMTINNSYMVSGSLQDALKGDPDFVIHNSNELQKAPMIIDGNTMVPVRAISEASGCEVQWDENARTVIINNTVNNAKLYLLKTFGDAFNITPLETGFEVYNGYKYCKQFYQTDHYRLKEYIEILIANGFLIYQDNADEDYVYDLILNDGNDISVYIVGGNDYVLIGYDIPVNSNIVMNTCVYYPNTIIPTYDSITGMQFIRSTKNAYGYIHNSNSANLYISYLRQELDYELLPVSAEGVTLVSPDKKYVVNVDIVTEKSGEKRTLISYIVL